MNKYAAGTTVTLTIPFQDLNGNAVTPTALSWRLLDQFEQEVMAPQSLAVAGTEASIAVPGANNALAAGELEGLREVELTMTTANGPIVVTAAYLIKANVRLVVLQNSFQTFGEATLTASKLHGLDGWNAATDEQRQSVLAEAFSRLIRLGYRVRWPEVMDYQNRLNWREHERVTPLMWPEMSLDQWKTWYPETFREALRRAQVAEANDILAGNVIEGRRESGLLSESIGESSMMFRPGKPLNLGISRAALNHLEGFVDLRVTNARA